MTVRAPICGVEGCRHPSWNGPCWQHRTGSVAVAPISVPMPTIPRSVEIPSVGDIWSDSTTVFEDISDVLSTSAIREQVRGTVTAAVSLEAYRNFASLNVADSSTRDQMARQLREDIKSRLTPHVVTTDVDEARDLMNSSSDEFGRTAEDSAGLIGYGLTKEWQLGRAVGMTESEDGIPYDNDLDEFVTAVGSYEVSKMVDDQFSRELSRFDRTLSETGGGRRKNPAPFADDLLYVGDDKPSMTSDYEVEREVHVLATQRQHEQAVAAAEAQRERRRAVLRFAGGVAAGIVVNRALDLDGRLMERRMIDAQLRRNGQKFRK